MISLSDIAQKQILDGMKKSERDQAILEKKLDKADKTKRRVESKRLVLTEEFLLDKMTREEYLKEKAELDRQLDQADDDIGELNRQLEDLKICRDKEVERDMEKRQDYSGATELTQELVGALVEKILFHDKEHIEICWRFSDEFLELVGWK